MQQNNLLHRIDWSTQSIPIVFPINHYIAVNPVFEQEGLSFEEVLKLQNLMAQNSNVGPWKDLNQKIGRFLEYFLGSFHCPNRDKGLYQAWLLKFGKNADLSASSYINNFFIKQNFSETQQETWMRHIFAQLPGWVGYLKWMEKWCRLPADKKKACRLELLAIYCLSVDMGEIPLWPYCATTPKMDPSPLYRYEKLYISYLQNKLEQPVPTPFYSQEAPQAQFIFCMDPRSLVYRNALNALPNIQSFSMAGFFGLFLTVETPEHSIYATCPARSMPKHHVKLHKASNTWFKQGLDKLSLTKKPYIIEDDSIPDSDQLAYALEFIKLLNINVFSKNVVICGHGSDLPSHHLHRSAFQCGACGGHDGSINAQIMAHILNKKIIRQKLEDMGYAIPEQTQFFAAKHDTKDQKLYIFNAHSFDHKILESIKQINGHLKKSSAWCDVGLSGHRAFWIGPFAWARHMADKQDSFVHHYDYRHDLDGTVLGSIVSQNIAVAQWINHHYLWASLSPNYHSKDHRTHHLVHDFGVRDKKADLLFGLPKQALMHHNPIRLWVGIYAPKAMMDALMLQETSWKSLVEKGWIHLICVDPNTHIAWRWLHHRWCKI